MGAMLGHVALGGVFFLIGIWHLYNHIKLHITHKHNYKSLLPYFPTSIHRHLELYLIIAGCTIFTISELHSRLLDPDGTIPSSRLNHYEHSSMAVTFILYCLTAIFLDRFCSDLVWLVASLAFAQELLLFHFHSTDHVGVERQYHLLLEFVVLVCLVTTLMGITSSTSFVVGFMRSLSVTLQGIWLNVMGIMLWTPELVPKGCSILDKDGKNVVSCDSEGSLDRAKALVNIEFSWILIGLTGFAVLAYVLIVRKYEGFLVLDGEENVRFKLGDDERLLHCEKGFPKIDLEE